jgi:hypothetical protein
MNPRSSPSAATREYAQLLLELHALDQQGREESADAEAIRDKMDRPWYAMPQRETDLMRGLSEDLYQVSAGKYPSKAMTPEERHEYAEAGRQALARFDVDPDPWLHFLRRPYPEDLPSDAIPYWQSETWQQLGFPEAAQQFRAFAERCSPGGQTGGFALLILLLGTLTEAA